MVLPHALRQGSPIEANYSFLPLILFRQQISHTTLRRPSRRRSLPGLCYYRLQKEDNYAWTETNAILILKDEKKKPLHS